MERVQGGRHPVVIAGGGPDGAVPGGRAFALVGVDVTDC